MILRAVEGKIPDVKNLAHTDADHGNHYPMPGLARHRRFIGPHFAAPCVGTNRRQILAANPLGGLKSQAGSVAAGVSSPIAGIEAALHLSGTHNHEIAAPDLDALGGGALFELIGSDSIAVLEERHALESCDIEQHSPAHHFVFRLFDPVFVGAL